MKINYETVVADMLSYLSDRTNMNFLLDQAVSDPIQQQVTTKRYLDVLNEIIIKHSQSTTSEHQLPTMYTCMCGTGTEECPDPKTNKLLCQE